MNELNHKRPARRNYTHAQQRARLFQACALRNALINTCGGPIQPTFTITKTTTPAEIAAWEIRSERNAILWRRAERLRIWLLKNYREGVDFYFCGSQWLAYPISIQPQAELVGGGS